jgi:GNAT superfamily N-acetyltransferase
MVIIRKAKAADAAPIARVVVDTWRSTYTGIVPASFLDALSYEKLIPVWHDHVANEDKTWPGWFVYVAETSDNQIFGFAGGGPTHTPDLPFDGELGFIYLLKAYQGLGTGRRLVAAVAGRLKQMGLNSMVVWAFTANPYRAFYEALGGRVAGERMVDRYGGNIPETAYGWDNLDTLLKSLDR